jgi:hypothetical protein
VYGRLVDMYQSVRCHTQDFHYTEQKQIKDLEIYEKPNINENNTAQAVDNHSTFLILEVEWTFHELRF